MHDWQCTSSTAVNCSPTLACDLFYLVGVPRARDRQIFLNAAPDRNVEDIEVWFVVAGRVRQDRKSG
jgi:hypothetical protein